MPVFKQIDSVPEKMSANFERRIVHLNDIMMVVCDFTNGPMQEPDKPHNHPHEQITFVAEGELYFFIGDEKHHLSKGDIFSVPPGIFHGIQTLSSFVRLVDNFSPIREEFLKKS